MWKINNHDDNKLILKRYNILIDEFFKLLIKLSAHKNKNLLIKDKYNLNKIFDKSKTFGSDVFNIKIKKDDSLKDLILEIIKMNPNELRKEYKIYKLQNSFLNTRNYNLKEKTHPENLKKLFKIYFYTKFFDTENNWLWFKYTKYRFSRKIYKKNFQLTNKLFVCPYCDADSIYQNANSEIEHFLPKNKFPYLATNINNLIPSCKHCNSVATGKGENVLRPITNQYIEQIGDTLNFKLIRGKITIDDNNKESIENYVKLLKLRNKYNDLSESILIKIKDDYQKAKSYISISGVTYTDESYIKFLEFFISKKNPFYFVNKDLLKDLPTI